MRKVIITLAYNRPEVVEQSLIRLRQTQDLTDYEYYLIDPGYPIPSKRENFLKIVDIAKRYQVEYLKPATNRGVSGNWMWAIYELGLGKTENDVIIGMDPDSNPMDNGWCDAIVDVIVKGKEKIAYCGLTRTSPPDLATEVDESQRAYTLHNIGGRKVRLYSELISWPMGGFSARFARERGIHQTRSMYGYLELATVRAMDGTDWDWCMLDNFRDYTVDRGEDMFRQWKVAQAQGRTNSDFETFIKENKR